MSKETLIPRHIQAVEPSQRGVGDAVSGARLGAETARVPRLGLASTESEQARFPGSTHRPPTLITILKFAGKYLTASVPPCVSCAVQLIALGGIISPRCAKAPIHG